MSKTSPVFRLTVGISTRNRLHSLIRCIQSLQLISEHVGEIIVVDDCSDIPIEGTLLSDLNNDFLIPLKVIRQEKNKGYIVARNLIVKEAKTDFILNLDDDAFILEPEAIKRAVKIMLEDRGVAVVAFAQADESGAPWHASMQASPVSYDCYAPSFIGFAHLLKRDIFLSLGGYREQFYFYGEEKEYCLRLFDAGHRVVYLPDALVAHVPDPAGRDSQKYLRYTVRNNCLGAIYNEPLAMLMFSLPVRLCLYFRMRRAWKIDDPGGFTWILDQVFSALPKTLRERRPLRLRTFKRWRQLRQDWPPYSTPDLRNASPALTGQGHNKDRESVARVVR